MKDSASKIKVQIGQNIKRIREEMGLPVKKVYQDLEISAAAYSNIERGNTDMSISRILQLADYFKIHFSKILAIDNVINYTFNPHNSSTGIQNNNQIANNIPDAYLIAIENLKNEVEFLRSQNTSLLGTKKN